MALEIYICMFEWIPPNTFTYTAFIYIHYKLKENRQRKKNCEEIFSTSDVCHGRHMDWFHHIWVRSEYNTLPLSQHVYVYTARTIYRAMYIFRIHVVIVKNYNGLLRGTIECCECATRHTHTHNTHHTNSIPMHKSILAKRCNMTQTKNGIIKFVSGMQTQNFLAFNNCETLMVTMT